MSNQKKCKKTYISLVLITKQDSATNYVNDIIKKKHKNKVDAK